VRRLRRCAHSPKRDHDGHAQWIFVTLIVHRPSGLQGTRGGLGPALGRAAGAGTAGHVAAPELPRVGQRELEPQDTWRPRSCPGLGSGSWSRRSRGGPGAASDWVEGAGAAGHVAAPAPTSAGRRGPELQLAWQGVYTRPAPCLDLELVCGGTWFSGYRQWPSGPPRERLRTRRWGQFFGAPIGYLDLFTRQSTTGLPEVPELKVRERHDQRENIDSGHPGGVGAEGPGAPTINVKKSTAGPWKVPELKVRERPPPT
jgi:hypothetical protein